MYHSRRVSPTFLSFLNAVPGKGVGGVLDACTPRSRLPCLFSPFALERHESSLTSPSFIQVSPLSPPKPPTSYKMIHSWYRAQPFTGVELHMGARSQSQTRLTTLSDCRPPFVRRPLTFHRPSDLRALARSPNRYILSSGGATLSSDSSGRGRVEQRFILGDTLLVRLRLTADATDIINVEHLVHGDLATILHQEPGDGVDPSEEDVLAREADELLIWLLLALRESGLGEADVLEGPHTREECRKQRRG